MQQRVNRLGEAQISTSIIVAAELRFGVQKPDSIVLATKVVEALERRSVISLRTHVDPAYARIRTQLEGAGTPIGSNAYLTAAQAIAHGLLVVTNNVREFSRVESLQVENRLRENNDY